MILEWTIECDAEFPEDDIKRICNWVRMNGYTDEDVVGLIDDVVSGFEDITYYNWGVAQTKEVVDEVKRRTEKEIK